MAPFFSGHGVVNPALVMTMRFWRLILSNRRGFSLLCTLGLCFNDLFLLLSMIPAVEFVIAVTVSLLLNPT